MRQAHGGARLINFLPAGAAGAVDVHLDVRRVNFHFDGIVDFRHDFQRGERGMAAAGSIKRGNAHQTMDAVFALEETVRILPFD